MDKELPVNRADWSFGDLLFWHLFIYGTRPQIDPLQPAGRVWDPKEVRDAVRVSDNTVRNWIWDRNQPNNTTTIERELFGKSSLYDEARLELRTRFRETRARNAAARKAAKKSKRPPPPAPTGRAVVVYRTPYTEDNLGSVEPDEDVVDEAERERFGAIQPIEVENLRKYRATAANDGPLITLSPLPWQPIGQGPYRRTRRTFSRIVAGSVVLFLGVYGWTRWQAHYDTLPRPDRTTEAQPPQQPQPPIVIATRGAETPPKSEKPEQPSQKPPPTADEASKPKTPPPAEPQPPAQPQPQPQPSPEPRPAPQPQAAPAPAPQVPPTPVTPKPPSEAEKRAAEERRIEVEAFAARKAAHDAAERQKELDAIRQDQEAADAAKAQHDRESMARTVAGVGFDLRENTSVAGASIGHVPALTVADCAIACLRGNCDAFAYYKDGPKSPKDGSRDCYRYRKPLTFFAHSNYTAGERIPDAASPGPVQAGASSTAPPAPIAEAGQADTLVPPRTAPDGLIQCPNGPVKVTGFKISCDSFLSGGTTLGSAQLSYTVATINECAAKCRPIGACVGFTFNAADAPGRHSCQIFGAPPEAREVNGWITGVR